MFMKKLNKTLSLLLVTIMLLSMATTVLAVDSCPFCGSTTYYGSTVCMDCDMAGTICEDCNKCNVCDAAELPNNKTSYTNGTDVSYTNPNASESYVVNVPATLAPGSSGTVTVEGTWPSNRILNVTSETSVTMTNSIENNQTKELSVTFDGIAKVGNNTVDILPTDDGSFETVSVADWAESGENAKPLFGQWSGTFYYNVEMEDVALAPGLYETGAIALWRSGRVDEASAMMKTSWEDLVANGVIAISDGPKLPDNLPEKNTYGFYYGVEYSLTMDGMTIGFTFNEDSSAIFNTPDGLTELPAGLIVYGDHTIDMTALDMPIFTVSDDGTIISAEGLNLSLGEYAPPKGAIYLPGLNLESPTSIVEGDLVIIDNGSAKTLQFGAFIEQTKLTGIEIPEGVTTIGDYAFSQCSRLTNATIPNGVTSIGDFAFYDCHKLTSIEIPGSVTNIGISAFDDCESLTSIIIPNSVTTIGRGAFKWCDSLESIVLPFVGGSANENTYLGYIFGSPSIDKNAQSVPTSLKSITISDTCQSIGDYAFSQCSYLTNINIPDSVTSIGEYAFYYCSRLTNTTIPENVTSIGDYAFHNCAQLRDIIIPNSVTSIGKSAFSSCSNLTNITIGNSVTSIGGYAFAFCKGLTSITITNSVTSIGERAFYDCSQLTEIIVDANNPNYCDIDGVLFDKNLTKLIQYPSNKTNSSYVVPNSVTSIGDYAFASCDGLTSITIPNGVMSIGDYTFNYCKGLTSMTIPESVTSIGDCAFQGCYSLTSMTIPESVTSIGSYAFRYCYRLVEIYNLSSLLITKADVSNAYAVYYTLDIYTSLESQSKLWTDVNGYIFYEDGSTCYLIGYCGVDSDLTLPDSCNGKPYEIYKYSFCWNTALTSITIPYGVTSIGESAFRGCTGLTSITIPSSVTFIGKEAFYNCESLINVAIPENITSISEGTFAWCENLISVIMPNSLTTINDEAFSNCSSLTSITIPKSVTSIGESAFKYCYNLVEVYNLSSLLITKGSNVSGYVGRYALDIYASLEEPSKLWTDANGYIFYEDGNACYLIGYCGVDSELTLPDSCNGKPYEIYKYSFYGQSGLTSITIPNSVTSIGYGAFWDCDLSSVTIGNGVTSIAGFAFACNNLTSITFSGTISQWEAIEKGSQWNSGIVASYVACADGDVNPFD